MWTGPEYQGWICAWYSVRNFACFAPMAWRSLSASPSCAIAASDISVIYWRPLCAAGGGFSSLRRDGGAGEGLDHVHQPVGRPGRALLVRLGDRPGDVGMELRRLRQIRRLLVVLVPEAPRERRHEAHGAGGELILRCGDAQLVELAVDAHEALVVLFLGAALEELRQFRHPRALGIARPPRGAARDEAFDLAARLE